MHQYCMVSVSHIVINPVSACRSTGSGSSPRCLTTCRSWRRSNSCSRRRRRTPRDAWSKSSGYTRRATGQSSTRQGRDNPSIENKRRLFALFVKQGVTKRCRLPWLTNSALVYEPKCGEGEKVAWSQPMSTAVHMEPK